MRAEPMKQTNRTTSIGLAMVLATASAIAQAPSSNHLKVLWAPPAIDLPDEHPASNSPNEIIASLSVDSKPIVLNRTSRAMALSALGGTEGQQGDAGDWESWLCFHGRTAQGRWMLWLLSSEVDNEDVSGFQWMLLSPGDVPDRRCKPIAGASPVKLSIPLKLGISESDARRLLGKPCLVFGNLLEFSYEHEQKNDQGTYTLTNEVDLVLNQGRIQSIRVWRSEID